MKTANTIEQREKDGITILDLNGKLTLGFENATLQAELLGLLDAGTNEVILNLRGVTAIDTAGCAAVIFCGMKFAAAGGKLAILNLSESLGTVADILKLSLMFEIHHDEMDAVNSFFPERAVTRYDILQFVQYCRASWTPSIAAA